MESTPNADGPVVTTPRRLVFLDGIRALAALYVVAHHMYITVYPGFPSNDGPWILGWLLYGHFGVAVFIVVSGFSLTLAPAKRGYQITGGLRRFFNRRAWRIIPPYWAALFLSVVIVGGLVNLRIHDPLTAKGVLTHFFLVQDIFSGVSPNGAFWSIAIEWQLYFVFPLFLLTRRRLGGARTVILWLAVVTAFQLLAKNAHAHVFSHILDLSPQFAALFVFGIVAAGATQLRAQGAAVQRRIPWGWISIALWVTAIAVFAAEGSVRVTSDFYWPDILVGAAVATGLAALVGPSGPIARRPFETRPLVRVGRFSYSLYLIHAPLLLIGWLFVVKPLGLSNNASFAVMVLGIGPCILAASYGFFLVFERPFLENRTWTDLRRRYRPAPKPAPVELGSPEGLEGLGVD